MAARTTTEEQRMTVDDLLSHLEWREASRLCTSSGRDWAFQEPTSFVAQLQTSLAQQYSVWLQTVDSMEPERSVYNLMVGGAGTGKSRTLEHSKELLLSAAERIGDPVLVDRIASAHVFHVSFENATALLVKEGEYPEADVSLRMLYQLMKDPGPWEEFTKEMVSRGPYECLAIEGLVTILARLQGFQSERQLTIILCVDGIEAVTSHRTSCGAKTILETVKSESAFIVGVFATAAQNPVDRAMSRCGHDNIYLRLPPLDGFAVCHPRSHLERQLIAAVDGHGRALEVVEEVLGRYTQQQIDAGHVDAAVVYTSHQAGAELRGLEAATISQAGRREVITVSDASQSRPTKKQQRGKVFVCAATETVSSLVDCSPYRVIHHRVEIIQCMGLLPVSETTVTTAVIQQARTENCVKASDILVVVVKAEQADDLVVPVNCGVVTSRNWREFFCPFACLADMCVEIQSPPAAVDERASQTLKRHASQCLDTLKVCKKIQRVKPSQG